MKTQLLEDIGDNGSRSTLPAQPPAQPPGPPQQARQQTPQAEPVQPAQQQAPQPRAEAPARPPQAPGVREPAVWHRPQSRDDMPAQRAADNVSSQRAPQPGASYSGPTPGLARPAAPAGARMGAPAERPPAAQPPASPGLVWRSRMRAGAEPQPDTFNTEPPVVQPQPQTGAGPTPDQRAQPLAPPTNAFSAGASAAPPAPRYEFQEPPARVMPPPGPIDAGASAVPEAPSQRFQQRPEPVTPQPGAFSAGAPGAPQAPPRQFRERPESVAPAPGAFSATGQLGAGLPPASASAAAEAEYLARMGRTAPQEEAPAAVSGWTRRALGYSLGFTLLAAVVAGGLWLYEDRRVEGALVVVANRNAAQDTTSARPAPVPALPPASAPAPAGTVGATAPVATAPPVAEAPPAVAPTAPDDRSEISGAAAAPSARDTLTPPPAAVDAAPVKDAVRSAPRTARGTVDDSDSIAETERPVPRTRRHARHARKAAPIAQAPVERAPAEPSPRQRREETLMQCRAHGYDERQCVARGCDMTRFGFACRG